MTEFADFETPPGQAESKKSFPTILWIIGGLGCGCFGLIIILGIIGAIALPSLLTKANKAREAEARNNVNSMVRGQQAYHIEKGTFSNSIEELGVGIRPETENYRYQIVPQAGNKSVMITAQAKDGMLKSYTGAVFTTQKGQDVATVSGVCETMTPSITPPAMPKLTGNQSSPVECPPGSQPLNR
jgi:type II secretory pathway pseudopilin PulG